MWGQLGRGAQLSADEISRVELSGVRDVLASALCQLKTFRADKREYDKEVANVLVESQSGDGIRQRDTRVHNYPELACTDEALSTNGSFTEHDTFANWLAPMTKELPRMIPMLEASNGGSGILDHLRRDWGLYNTMVTNGTAGIEGPTLKKNYILKPACNVVKYCLCRFRGGEIWRAKLW